MIFHPTSLKGAYVIEPEKKGDDRGFFARIFCREEFIQRGLEYTFVQANNSFSSQQGTLRGLHYQLPPYAETKLVRCIQGSFYDVILDLRPNSLTFGHSYGTILSKDNRKMMYVPQGFAHGFITLESNSEVLYLVSQFYSMQNERGIRWNDPSFSIQWIEAPTLVSERDASHPDFHETTHLL